MCSFVFVVKRFVRVVLYLLFLRFAG
ncbi:MAG: hypothetical protein H6R00_1897, partial [Proteobacteria bacterium]|nr:hypothetical protein [Pseudomonadota bacterium]